MAEAEVIVADWVVVLLEASNLVHNFHISSKPLQE